MGTPGHTGEHRLGLRENWWQFLLFTLITLLVGTTIGVERVVLPPLFGGVLVDDEVVARSAVRGRVIAGPW